MSLLPVTPFCTGKVSDGGTAAGGKSFPVPATVSFVWVRNGGTSSTVRMKVACGDNNRKVLHGKWWGFCQPCFCSLIISCICHNFQMPIVWNIKKKKTAFRSQLNCRKGSQPEQETWVWKTAGLVTGLTGF